MPFLRRRWLAVQPISSIQGCSSGGTAWAVSWPPIQSDSSVSTTLRLRRNAARAPATPPVPLRRPVCLFWSPEYSLFQSAAPDDVGVPAGARLGDAPLRSIFHEHDPEPLGVPFGPFEVVQERPHHVTVQVNAALHRLVGCPEVGVKVRDTLLVVHVALRVYVVVDGPTVLGYVDGQVCIVFLDPDQNLRQAIWLHRPAHSSLLHLVRHYGAGSEVGEGHALPWFLRRVANGVAEVVVDPKEVDGN